MKKHCCEQMEAQIEDGLVEYEERFDGYVIIVERLIEAAMKVSQEIEFCPWCGVKLPKTMRDRWFDELEAMGIDPFHDPVPEKYKTKEWRS